MGFKDSEKSKQKSLINEGFYGKEGKGEGAYKGKNYSHILNNAKLNLYTSIRKSAIRYFHRNKIAWWGSGTEPTGNTLSSQVACLNHLFPFMHDYNAVKAIVKGIDEKFVDIIPIYSDEIERDDEYNIIKTYISFEVVSKIDHMNEGILTRGANCTSIDALVLAKDIDGLRYIIPIEWKYTENLSNSDKSNEDRKRKGVNLTGTNGSGLTRMLRYNELISSSKYLTPPTDNKYQSSKYYKETYYQLMRQTLWAEQMIVNQFDEGIDVDDYLHLHVIPKGNYSLLRKKNKKSGEDMETTWINMLTEEGKKRYKTIDPEELLAPIVNDKELSTKYSCLIAYLKKRYWDRP